MKLLSSSPFSEIGELYLRDLSIKLIIIEMEGCRNDVKKIAPTASLKDVTFDGRFRKYEI
jgi:hypothetical protein